MAYKDILVYLDSCPDSDNRLNLAISLAASFGARLVGVDACSKAAFEGQWRDRAVELPDRFETAVKEAGIRAVYRVPDRTRSGAEHYYSHFADLIIASQPELEARALVADAVPEGVLLAGGVPVLLLPYDLKLRGVLENIVIAWKPSREAARAVHDAMPILSKAKKVTVFTFGRDVGALDEGANLLIEHLREHGVRADVDSWPDTGEMSVADGLFACLETQEADLIVAGAYGHSRLFEGLFGGVSRDLVRQPSLPILMSH